jgi:hypothetical protein
MCASKRGEIKVPKNMSDEEIKAYTAGFQAGFYHMRGIILNWAVEKKHVHSSCKCSLCVMLRQVADGSYGGVNTQEGQHL